MLYTAAMLSIACWLMTAGGVPVVNSRWRHKRLSNECQQHHYLRGCRRGLWQRSSAASRRWSSQRPHSEVHRRHEGRWHFAAHRNAGKCRRSGTVLLAALASLKLLPLPSDAASLPS